ncbi:hypothetical protein BWD42_04135 [Sphingobacterium sp. CZ-UAM]|uniref:hypothetical protein n=1 Tax=Sphingobacterium sp. CZ-UAM TaxID=1933868 RepID=UPI000986243F|nr:hypothetical protein [Sphingobacterium sp. CZ-UAM]OOG19147.1 hypothetical protein BWD42_04135 [Sphingobacterium sp. CZ-UAM]
MKIIDERHLFDVKIGDAQFYVLALTIVAAMNAVGEVYLDPLAEEESIEFTAQLVPEEEVDKITFMDCDHREEKYLYRRIIDYVKSDIQVSDNPNILTSTEW